MTDSTADLTPEQAGSLAIQVVPLVVRFGEESYLDGLEMDAAAFYRRLENEGQGRGLTVPRTSQPAPAAFLSCYEQLRDAGVERVLVFTLSAQLSGTHQSATVASQLVEGVEVTVVDSDWASWGLGWQVLAAARHLADGGDAAGALKAADGVRRSMRAFFTLETLRYLEANGRIGKAQALAGGLLHLHPVLTLSGGEVTPVTTVMGYDRMLRQVYELMREEAQQLAAASYRVAVVHAARPGRAQKIYEEVQSFLPVSEGLVCCAGPVLGSHAGPGLIGICYYPMEESE